jgi:Phosphate-selective porin O and P
MTTKNRIKASSNATKYLLALTFLSFSFLSQPAAAQSTADTTKHEAPKKWFETMAIRGYVQARYNRLFETNPDLKCEQCDRSWGDNGGFFLRRIRIIWSGQISKQVYFYIQPDFASSVSSTSLNFASLRDAYFDVGVDKKNEFRFRIGQSKIPFGFENLQSSQNRLPLDRADALNSALSNERDMGVVFYWAPEKIRKRFASLVADGLKGSGDYGVFGVGLYNGQTANKPELNNKQHLVARVSYPVEIKGQIIEAGVQGYSGKFVIPADQLSAGVKTNDNKEYADERFAGSIVLYPKPFGILAEYNIGRGPEFNKETDSIEVKDLHGGFITVCYKTQIKKHVLIPFARWQYYHGGKKHELDARSYRVEEYEIGIEWQPVKQFEFVAMYTISSRQFEDYKKQDNLQEGNLLRLQAQINF